VISKKKQKCKEVVSVSILTGAQRKLSRQIYLIATHITTSNYREINASNITSVA